VTTPKEHLLRSQIRASELQQALSDPRIEEAAHIAFAQYAFTLNDPNPAAADLRRQGAREVLSILLKIATPNSEPTYSGPKQLNQ